ncbi:hypothetical protein FI667_g6971, partial [Globisporangium splendens]
MVTTAMPSDSASNPNETKHADSTDGSTAEATGSQNEFGRLGISMFLLAWVCVGWTVWLTSLSVNPRDAVAQVMSTKDFEDDDGVYDDTDLFLWQIADPEASVQALGIVGFVLMLAGYLGVALKLTVWQQWSRSRFPPKGSGHDRMKSLDKVVTVKTENQLAEAIAERRRKSISRSAAGVHKELEQVKKSLVKNKVRAAAYSKQLVYDLRALFDELFSSVLWAFAMLIQILERGLPAGLVWVFAACLVANALSCAIVIHSTRDRRILGIALMDAFPHMPPTYLFQLRFDLVNAIMFPMVVLSYSAGSFRVARDQLALNAEIFPPGGFERCVSSVIDQTELETLRRCLNALRITGTLDFVTKVLLNGLLAYRAIHVINLNRHAKTRTGRLYPRRHPVALPFLFFGLLTIIFVIVSVHTSEQACENHPECVVHAHRWVNLNNMGDLTKCPCLALVDIERAPTSYAEWRHPTQNVTEKVSNLATSGCLESIYLANRFLPTLPDQLKRCTCLRSLYGSLQRHTHHVPLIHFTKLELLHIDGKPEVSGLTMLLVDLFVHMDRLVLLTLGSHESLTRLPSLGGLKRLQTLVLDNLPALQELPSLDALSDLKQLHLTTVPALAALPDMAAIQNGLQSFTLLGRSPICCNGFLGTSTCDLSHAFCVNDVASCVTASASAATLSVMDTFASSVCRVGQSSNGSSSSATAVETEDEDTFTTTDATVDACNGTLYKECAVVNGSTGSVSMCYNPHMTVIHCTQSPFAIAMRKQQIIRGIGAACDPVIETWLGCV